MKNKKQYSIAVIIPAYNVESWIEECLDSVVRQTVPFDEIIVINDGSNDKTFEICKRYALNNSQIRLFDQTNKGLGAARNYCIDRVVSDYFILLDGDDKLDLTTCELLHASIKDLNLDVLYFDGTSFGDTKLFNEKNEYFSRKGDYSDRIYSGAELFDLMFPSFYRESACLAIYRTVFLKENDIRFPEGIFYEDCFFSYSVIQSAKRVMHRALGLYLRRFRTGSITNSSFSRHHLFSYAKTSEMIWRYIQDNSDCFGKNAILYSMSYLRGLYNHIQKMHIDDDEEMKIALTEAINAFVCLIMKGKNEIIKYTEEEEFRMKLLLSLLRIEKLKLFDLPYEIKKCLVNLLNWGYVFFEEALKGLMLSDPNKKIGVYGIGKCTEDMIEGYKRLKGEIKATLYYIDSAKNGESYNGQSVYGFSDVCDLIDMVIISSCKYHSEISELVHRDKPDLCIMDPYEFIQFSYFAYADLIYESRKELDHE